MNAQVSLWKLCLLTVLSGIVFAGLTLFFSSQNQALREARKQTQSRELERVGGKISGTSVLDLSQATVDRQWIEVHLKLEEYKSFDKIILKNELREFATQKFGDDVPFYRKLLFK